MATAAQSVFPKVGWIQMEDVRFGRIGARRL